MSNIATLTRSHAAIAAKKKARKEQIKEIVFDDSARHEFLTGFHKRKLAKTDAARRKAIEREKQERLESRRDQRRMLRERAIENAAFVEGAYGGTVESMPNVADSDDEWAGVSSSSKGKQKQKEQEYEDEEVLATVAVVEDFDPDSLLHGPPKRASHAAVPPASGSVPSVKSDPRTPKSEAARSKTKHKKIKYQTKEDRKSERAKQRTRKLEKAELAGGKASRRRSGGSTKGKKPRH